MRTASTQGHDAPIIEAMSAHVELDELYRMSTDDYHRLIESGAFDEFPNCELIDGLLVLKDMKSPEHENAIAWLLQWAMLGADLEAFQVRASAALTLTGSEPEPDLMVIARDTPRPYHPGSAVLAVEVSISSLRRDLKRKAELYAEAGVGEYWVFDVAARRVVVHRAPHDGHYAKVLELRAGGRLADPPAGLPELCVDELLRATYG